MTGVPSVMVVDDDESFLASVGDGLSKEPYDVRLARDGAQALALLQERPADLVVTDVKMPRLDGVGLLATLLSRGDFTPCLVMSAFATPELEQQTRLAGGLEVLAKPVDLHELRSRIREQLGAGARHSLVRGLSLASFLQLLAVERKSCVVKVKSGGRGGLLWFEEGNLVDAATTDLQGTPAAHEVLSWDPVEIVVAEEPRPGPRKIHESLDSVLLEALRLKDEAERETGQRREENVMAIEAQLGQFKDIKGYLASGIMNFTGEVLASHSASNRINLEATGAVFNDIFRGAHEASGKIGLEACRNMVISTPNGQVVMECSGTKAGAHIHFIVVLEHDGNQALVKMTLGKVVPAVVGELS